MAILFREYDLLASSSLFDAEYYVRTNPDIAELNIDPVLHYLEFGAGKELNPSADFDSAYYLEQCRAKGEVPVNPLVHYLTVGAALGLKLVRVSTETESARNNNALDGFVIRIERVSLVRVKGAKLRLALEGWAMAHVRVARITAYCNEVELGNATIGMARPDVAQAYPNHANASSSGFVIVAEFDAPSSSENLNLALLLVTSVGREHRHELQVGIDPTTPAGSEARMLTRPARVKTQLPPMRLEIDEASVDEKGILTLAGWALCCLDIESIKVFVDDEFVGSADYGRVRQDVALARKEYPRALHSGFGLNADLTRFGSGEKTIKVEAVAQSGISRHALVPVSVCERMPPSAEKAFHFHCDDISLSTSGRVNISGWMICGSTTESIVVSLDGNEIGCAIQGLARSDVGNAFPGISYAGNSGFSFRQSQNGEFAAGEHLIVLTVRDASGVMHNVPLPVLAIEDAGAATRSGGIFTNENREEIRLSLDSPRITNGVADSPVISSLSINGWALARTGVSEVSISIDETPVGNAQHGIRRVDVATAFPDRSDALQSGFATVIPYWLLPRGTHTVRIAVKDASDHSASVQFRIEVEEIPEGDGPWSLRRKLSHAELELQMSVLAGLQWMPRFCVLLATCGDDTSLIELRKTLASLREQAYPHWSVSLVSRERKIFGKKWRTSLLAGIEDLHERVKFRAPNNTFDSASAGNGGLRGRDRVLFMPLSSGDELGCDALLEMAIASGLARSADLFYSDERCNNAVTDTVQAYFKPGWSPDLLLSTNYVGRAWCAHAAVFQRAGLSLNDWLEHGDYDLVLRATEAAKSVHHLSKVLCERGSVYTDGESVERRALLRALLRRDIQGEVKKSFGRGFYRVKPKKAKYGRVSIIIPTRASRGLIKTCLKTLKAKTAYRDYEIICIENIPPDQPKWKRWLRQNADKVIGTTEPFNWSRYNNLCAQQASGRFLLFLNDDIEILEPDWLDTLLHIATRSQVGIVGPQLLYPDRTVQHAGLALTNVLGRARHVFRHGREDDPGYFGLALAQRNVIGVTGACMMMRREVFDSLGGFDEAYNVINNDLDFCLRAWKRGLLIVYTPHTRLIHHEMISRAQLGDAFDSAAFIAAWHDVFVEGDPYLNRNISLNSDDLVPEREPVTAICAGHPLFSRESIRRILILKLDHIGDCITALPAIRKLRRHFPRARITVLSSTATRLVWSMEPAVDQIVEFNFFHARSQLGKMGVSEEELTTLGEQLGRARFDLAVDLRKSTDTRHVLQHTGAKYLAGFDYKGQFPWLDVALQWEGDPARQSKRQSIGDDLVNMIDAINASCENERKLLRRKPAPLVSLSSEEAEGLFDLPLVCVHAGAGNELKAWPTSSFRELIDLLVDREGVQIAMVGGPAEAALCEELIAGVRDPTRIRNLAGKLSLKELPDLFLRARLFIGNDSGPKHIAAALGIPTVGIHSGNIDPHEWGPVGPNATAIWRQTSCSPCYIDDAANCPRNLACLKGIGAGDVYRLCRKMLQIDVHSSKSPSGIPSAPGKKAAPISLHS